MTTAYTLICLSCPPGSQRGAQRATRAAALADYACGHTDPMPRIETWTFTGLDDAGRDVGTVTEEAIA